MDNTQPPVTPVPVTPVTPVPVTPVTPVPVTPVTPVLMGAIPHLKWYEKIPKKYWIPGAIFASISIFGGILLALTGDNNLEETHTSFSSAPPNRLEQQASVEATLTETGSKNTDSGSLDAGAPEVKKDIHKVFKLKTYTQGIDGSYTYYSYGSAVFIGEKRILTNAHVVLGSDDLPTGKYNLCLTEIDADLPTCVTPLRLIQYDTSEDIALLEVTEDVYLGEPITLEENKPVLGDTVKVYGYPANGGETLSLTEGKMSGTERGHYKIDANIDHGNSGGGAFSADGDFIGMPFSVQVGLSSMGYVIPVKTINEFLDNIGDIVDYEKDQSEFIEYMSLVNKMVQSGKITNTFFTFDGYKEAGFEVRDIKTNPLGYGTYTFVSESEKTVIIISVPYIIGKSYFVFSGGIEELEKMYARVSQKIETEENERILEEKIVVEGAKNYNGTIDENAAMYGYKYKGIEYFIATEAKNSEKDKVESARELYWNQLQFTKKNELVDQEVLEIYSGSFRLPEGTYALMQCGKRCAYKVRMNETDELKILSYAKNMEDIDGITLGDILKQTEKMYSQYSIDKNTFAVLKNTRGHEYLFSKSKNQKGETELSAIFYGQESSDSYTEYALNLVIADGNVETQKKFFEVVNSLELKLKSPFASESSNAQDTYESILEASENQAPSEPRETPEEDVRENTNTMTEATAGINYCETRLNGVTYTLNPCSIDETMSLSNGDLSFEYRITPSDANASYSFGSYGYGEGFPTYGILGGTSGGAQGTIFQNPYFNASILKKGNYTGYLKVQITGSNGAKARELRLKITLNVTE